MDSPQINFSQMQGNRGFTHGNDLVGSYTTKETPADAGFVVGSAIPVGRFIALAPQHMGQTSGSFRTVILPDKLGTSLFKEDGSDYSAEIGDAQPGGNFQFVGVSVGHRCPVACEQDWGKAPCPPIGYVNDILKWRFFRPVLAGRNGNAPDAVSAVHNDDVKVYCEVDIAQGDDLHIRVEELVPYDKNNPASIPQLLGGVTNTADAGTVPIASTRFKNAVVRSEAGTAGDGVWINLG